MTEKVVVISLFTLLIHTIETLAYSVRLAGIRTAKLAVALSLFNIIVILSRTANMVQAPLTASLIDFGRKTGELSLVENQFRIIIGSSTLGTVVAAILVPTFVGLFSRIILHFEITGSIPQLAKNVVAIKNLQHAKEHIRYPKWEMISQLRIGGVPKRLLFLNTIAISIYTVGILSALYASLISPEHSAIALMSSGLINGFATLILVIFVDPQIALLTDQVMQGTKEHSNINKITGILIISRFFGTILSQILLIPAAFYIAWLSKFFA